MGETTGDPTLERGTKRTGVRVAHSGRVNGSEVPGTGTTGIRGGEGES